MKYGILILFFALCSCSKTYYISGKSSVTQANGKAVSLRSHVDNEWVIRDSAQIIHGGFVMQGELDSAEIVSIFLDDVLLMPMVLESGRIEITYTIDGLQVRGTDLNERLYAFIAKKGEFDKQLAEALRIENRLILQGYSTEEAQATADQQAAAVTEKAQQLTKEFITANYKNLLGPSVFLMVCASSFPYPYLTPDLEAIYESAPSLFKENTKVKKYVEQAYKNIELLKERDRERKDHLNELQLFPDTIDLSHIVLP